MTHYKISPPDELYEAVLAFFGGDKLMTNGWFAAPNPLLGGLSPNEMLLSKKGAEKLRDFIYTSLEENHALQD